MRSKTMRKPGRPILRVILWIICAIVAVFLILLLTLSLHEYKPADREPLSIGGESSKTIAPGDSFNIVTWNIGYGALGADADFFMDGGSGVITSDKAGVIDHMTHMIDTIKGLDPDVLFCQEVDVNARRSFHIDETDLLEEALQGCQHTFAYNYKVDFIPYPMPPLGKVQAGIETFSRFEAESAERIQLPCPFSWPIRLANLKRCMAITRIPLEGSSKELILINTHLEAYDSGEGKAAQTAMLKEYMETETKTGNYVIVGGDFNQIFSDYAEAYPFDPEQWTPGIIETSEFEGWTFAADPATPSCRSLKTAYEGADPETFQYYLIDGFIVSGNIAIEELETVDCGFKWTDHNPVRMKVTLKDE